MALRWKPTIPDDNSPMMWWAVCIFTSLRGCIVFPTVTTMAASVGISTMFRSQPGFSCRALRIRRGGLDRPPTFISSNGSSGGAYGSPCARQEATRSPLSPELSVREWKAEAEDKASCPGRMLTSIDSLGE